ncbi:MAG: ribulose-phosphate 3-epimerase [Planctomycetota bacterium]
MPDSQPTNQRDLIRNGPGRVLAAPSILAADFANLADDCRAAIKAGADVLHIDVMDGHFVPNLTFGPALVASLRRALPTACLDVHLMITDPAAFVGPFAEAGADHITFHAEVVDEAEARSLADRVRGLGCTAGLAINPDTPIESVAGWLDAFEMLLVMSVFPGFGGQSFIEETLASTRAAAEPGRDLWVEMDGGLDPTTAPRAIEAGCDLVVAGSALFGRAREAWPGVIASLRGS